MIETALLNWWNLPATVVAAPFRMWMDYPLYMESGFGFFTSDIIYLAAVVFFWWSVGRQIDNRKTGS